MEGGGGGGGGLCGKDPGQVLTGLTFWAAFNTHPGVLAGRSQDCEWETPETRPSFS